MKTSKSTVGSDLDAYKWESPAVSSPSRGKKKRLGGGARGLARDASAPALLQGGGSGGPVQRNNFMAGHTESAASLSRQRIPAAAFRGAFAGGFGSKASSATKDDSGQSPPTAISAVSLSLPPKVFVPHNTRPGWTPRPVVVRRLQHTYNTMDVGALLEDRGLDLAEVYAEIRPSVPKAEDGGDSGEEDVVSVLNEADANFEFGSTVATDLIKMLPLHMFDDDSFEIYPLHTWVEHNAPGRALRGDVWCKCRAKALAPSTDEATGEPFPPGVVVEWCEGRPGTSTVSRLAICFDAEDPQNFADRVAACISARKLAESSIRYNLYIDCMPSDELGQLDAEQVSRLRLPS